MFMFGQTGGNKGSNAGEGEAAAGKPQAETGSTGRQDAGKGDAKLGQELTAAHEMLGDALLPFIPTAPLVDLFL
jgi:hypothetical protein